MCPIKDICNLEVNVCSGISVRKSDSTMKKQNNNETEHRAMLVNNPKGMQIFFAMRESASSFPFDHAD